MKIKITNFAKRHFDPKFGGTKIFNYTPEEFENIINESFSKGIKIGIDELKTLNEIEAKGKNPVFTKNVWEETNEREQFSIINGYAPFCKLIAFKNFTDAKVGSLPITLENYQYIRSGYSAREENELPVFSRWLELPVGKPKAKWLMVILYSKQQIEKEWQGKLNKKFDNYEKTNNTILGETGKKILMNHDEYKYEFEGVDFDYAIVAILGQSHSDEEPPKPETILRNALGIEEGGSGFPLDREKYLASVEFWSKNCTVK